MMLPSEALNRQFVLPDEPVDDNQLLVQTSDKFKIITTHAVLVGNIGLLLPSKQVSELVENVPICRLPNTPAWFNGVTSLRGNMIPVFDVHQLLGIQVKELRKLIIIGSGETAIAFWIDGMPRMVMVTSDNAINTRPPMPQLIKDHAESFFYKDDQIWIDWNVEDFFYDVGSRL